MERTITAMDNLQHTIIVPNNTRRTRTGTTALEKIKFSSLCNRLKAHLVHIPQDIDQFDGGPHTESETCEQQHKFMRELLYHTNRQNGGRDIAVRFAEEYMLRHIGEGGYFPNPSTSALEMCGASVQAAFDNTLIQSELELLDNNSSRKKLAGLFKSDSSSKPSKLVLGVIVQKINDNFVVEAYDFIPINNNPVSIYDSCQTDIAGNFIICRFPSDDFITHNSSTVTNPIEVIFDMAHPPILLDSRSTDLLCVNKSKFGTLWWLRNTTCDFEKIVAHQEINV
ncbi:hypothetical protein MFLAVUS_001039 [Mucor flavus]|uniref:Uncharacterized protein n=1 Tax=Mucor flavus TaxID=439312 RepID=A0ABP9YLC8_9FUNG